MTSRSHDGSAVRRAATGGLHQLLQRLLVAAWLACLAGCGDPAREHPAVGRTVGNLPLESLVDPDRPPPTFTGRVTLLHFWGTWCPPCRRELPGLVRLADRLRGEPAFQLVAVSCGGRPPEDMPALAASTTAFLDEAVREPQRSAIEPWSDPDGRVRMIFSASFGFEAFPTTYLIGPDATIRQVWVGYRSRDEADIARALVDLLKEAKAITEAKAVPEAPPAGR
ncbi:MAG: TlpA family protein disulfide reductase [Planctomycetia bacterium]